MVKRVQKDLAKFLGNAKIKAADVEMYDFVRTHVKIDPEENNVSRDCAFQFQDI